MEKASQFCGAFFNAQKMRLSECRVELVQTMPSVCFLDEANGKCSMVNAQKCD